MTALDSDVLAACRAAYVDPAPPVSSTVWERISPVWLPAYQAAAPSAHPSDDPTCEVPDAA